MRELSKSRFAMWRAVIAMMHADSVVKPHEVNFVLRHIEGLPLSGEQHDVLMKDIQSPISVEKMFYAITNEDDKEDFFHLARALAWADGDFDMMEEDILNRLGGVQVDEVNLSIVQKTRDDFSLYMKDHTGALNTHDETVLTMIRQLAASRYS